MWTDEVSNCNRFCCIFCELGFILGRSKILRRELVLVWEARSFTHTMLTARNSMFTYMTLQCKMADVGETHITSGKSNRLPFSLDRNDNAASCSGVHESW